MSSKKRKTPERRPQVDPATGLPPVGKDLPLERARVLARARAKHAPRQKRP